MTTRLVVSGLGLMGGSLALAARERGLFDRVVGIDVTRVISSDAARLIADELIDAADATARARALSRASVAFLAAPIGVIERQLAAALALAEVVTDSGSTKRTLIGAVAGAPRASRFVPGHPMAGAPESGLEHARADLFDGAAWVLCPGASDLDAVSRVEALVRGVGAVPVHMDAAEHDRAVALTSHAPQLLGSLLQILSVRRGSAPARGPAFERMTRGAGGAETMWRDIFATNGDEIAAVLRELAVELGAVAQELELHPPEVERALALLAEARRERAR